MLDKKPYSLLPGVDQPPVETGFFSRKNFDRLLGQLQPSRYQKPPEHYDARWDDVYAPTKSGNAPGTFTVALRVLTANVKYDVGNVKWAFGKLVPKRAAEAAEPDRASSPVSGASEGEVTFGLVLPKPQVQSPTPEMSSPKHKQPMRVLDERPRASLDR